MQVYILFNNITVISGQWEGHDERLCAMELLFLPAAELNVCQLGQQTSA